MRPSPLDPVRTAERMKMLNEGGNFLGVLLGFFVISFAISNWSHDGKMLIVAVLFGAAIVLVGAIRMLKI
jgi:hypothetical protein